MSKITVMAIVIVMLALGTGVYVLSAAKSDVSKKTSPNSNGQTSSESTTSPSPAPSDTAPAANTLTYTNSGFTQDSITVKAGSKITIKNDASRTLDFNSDPHPQHTDDPELNAGTINPGDTATITVTKTGSHGVHNHLNPSDTATIIVE